jgi:hypothetical protein
MTRTGAIESMFTDDFDAPRSYAAEYLANFRAPHANPRISSMARVPEHSSGLHEALIITPLLQWQHYWVAKPEDDRPEETADPINAVRFMLIL